MISRAEHKQGVTRKKERFRTGTGKYVALAFHTDDGATKSASQREFSDTSAEPDFGVRHLDLLEMEVPIAIIA
jgi:hypothetical protein